MSKNENLRHHIEGRHFTRATNATVAPLAEIIDMASRQLGYTDHTPVGMLEPTARIRKLAGTNGTLSLRSLLPEIKADPFRPTVATEQFVSGERVTLGEAVLRNSRVAEAHAQIITLPEPKLIDGAAPALQEVPSGLRVINPAPFAEVVQVDGEGEIPASTLASIIKEGAVDRSTMKQIAVRIPMARSDFRSVPENQLVSEVMASIAVGVGRAIDRILLSAIVAATPAAFMPAAAATKGIRWSELRALVGILGAGAAVDRGDLFVAGVPAEITNGMDETLVAAWDRFGVIVSNEIEVLATRMDARGGVELVCWFDAQAIIPDAGFAWAVA